MDAGFSAAKAAQPAVAKRDGYYLEREALASVLASDGFDRSKSLPRLLSYLCTKYFEGQAEEIKEYSIAVEALGRPPDFDQKKDSIVRVEMHRLRKRLREYYADPGTDDPVQIGFAEKGYVPEFTYKSKAVAPENEVAVTEAPEAEKAPDSAVPAVSKPESSGPKRASTWMLVGLGVLLAAAVVGIVVVRSGRRPATATAAAVPGAPVAEAPNQRAPALLPDDPEIRILAGRGPGAYTDRDGQVWEGDRDFQGGEAVTCRSDIIARGFDRNLFAGRREGRFEYAIPLKPGSYEMELLFAETEYGEGNPLSGGESSRVFEIRANGSPLVSAYDIVADAGAPNCVSSRLFKDLGPGPDGLLHLRFEPASGRKALVNAIRIRPGQPGRLNPIRIVARQQAYRDPKGRWWQPDRYYLGGVQIYRPSVPLAVDNADVYQGERYGNFTYAIPVPPGRYGATLYFYEYWWGKGRPGGTGGRRFDVYCNFRPLLTGFELAEEDGVQQAVTRTFHGLTPNVQGKLIFAFVPEVNYALVNAIEIVDETK